MSIGTDGTVAAGGRTLGRLDIVRVRSPQNLQPVGDNAFVPTAESGAPARAGADVTVSAGTLEASNVDMAEAIVAMIESQRAFELASKAIHTADQMMGTANEVKR